MSINKLSFILSFTALFDISFFVNLSKLQHLKIIISQKINEIKIKTNPEILNILSIILINLLSENFLSKLFLYIV